MEAHKKDPAFILITPFRHYIYMVGIWIWVYMYVLNLTIGDLFDITQTYFADETLKIVNNWITVMIG